MDVRHRNRVKIVQELFSYEFKAKIKKPLLKKIVDQFPHLDNEISSAAPKYEVSKIAKVDLSILRLATFELLISKLQPTKVIINEAIELAKELGSEKSPGFVNAVLGKIVIKNKIKI
ncbi:hypothetical protein A3C23_03545 [Candidatus Roizmanbacteria bacterium RIFCSPHIGHO2_02_FULL_37_13b]|uniref:NusB/RsmB/TIM44 domain-containing protein n=1 Tax=Candidatus Roizmanbacteria bacterium RIFCSPLOWO2_02_FULL_36_11 TaxID=1802071 RepID=A0A1F7JBZ6_9BACT|nr:MAG: hypothetical protein A3C23_03545 [Candidatus Roizmanbacteria bacterium RIFCSPHIGHO2_02_FULL_37_13b]OGK53139.1 MAG: hypothetical protein A3H78_02030 [Candidatus Roizmanbacteria bacterium RIFCSPLOWO2_02_FULL_36_11]